MKPSVDRIIGKTVVHYPHLFWLSNDKTSVNKSSHSASCWCRASEWLRVGFIKADNGKYFWQYVEGENLIDGGA